MIYILKSDTQIISDNQKLMQDVFILQLLEIYPVVFDIHKDTLITYDFLLITSKNAIKVLMQHELAEIFLQKPAIVIGEASKKTWLEAGGNVLFCPDAPCNGIMLAHLIKDLVKDKKLLYPCAKEKATNMATILQDICNIHEIIVYESRECEVLYKNSLMQDNTINNSHPLIFANESIFIFGSPKHYQAFLKRYGWNQTWVAISLGETTYTSFDENIRKLNAKGDFLKALTVAQAIRNDTPMQDNNTPKDLEDCIVI